MKIKGFMINVVNGTMGVKEVEGCLDSYYNLLGCDMIEIVSRKIGNYNYEIICDEEGLLKDKAIVSAFSIDGDPMLVGNLFVVAYEGMGELRSLTDDEIDNLKHNICAAIKPDRFYPILTNVEYAW